jgi:hypothetical protein
VPCGGVRHTLAVRRGLCVKHGGSTARKPCLVEGCGTLAQSRGLCAKHGGSNKKPCLVEGCGTLANSRGLCVKHGGGRVGSHALWRGAAR